MFERFDPVAARSLFFARKAVSDYGGTRIEPEHILIGVLDAKLRAVLEFANSPAVPADIRQRLVSAVASGTRVSTSHEITLSPEVVTIFERALIEADDASNATVQPEHLLLGILTKTQSQASAALTGAGVHMSAVRQALLPRPEDQAWE